MSTTVHQVITQSVVAFLDGVRSTTDVLTEDDMRCRLFSYLYQRLPPNASGVRVSLHSEVRWYGDLCGNHRPLKYRSDLVVIDDTTLKDDSEFFRAPSKGYGFSEYYGIIELKLRRGNGASDKVFLKEINADIAKLVQIKQLTSPVHHPVYILVVFDKKRDIRSALTPIPGIEMYYKYIETQSQPTVTGIR